MPTLIQCHRLTHRAGTKPLFTDLDLTLNSGDRIGLVGHNGCGKSTLLSLLNGTQQPDEGEISRSHDLHLETVEQFIHESLNDHTLKEALALSLPEEERAFGEYKVDMLLSRMEFDESAFDYRVRDLSGGQQNRLMFARAVINEPNLILFDEPTNHLDLRTLMFFESWLQQMNAGYLLISHDREFLDAVTNRTLFLRDERIYSFQHAYTEAKAKFKEQDEAAAARREAEEKNIKRLQASAKRLALWGKIYDNEDLAAKAKSMEKRIEKLEQKKTFVSRGSGLSLTLDVQQSRANRILQIEREHICAPGAGHQPLFFIEDFYMRPGDRVALLGHNGVGKTTLIKQIITQYRTNPELGIVRFNPQCQIGYYDQELALLNPDRSMVETLRDHCNGTENEYKSALIKAGFPYLDMDKRVGVLSGGEKARLMFLMIKLNKPNFLILDEPTNHIDISGKEELEAQILETDGAVLITSHDRRFISTIAKRFVLIKDGKLVELNDPETFYRAEPSLSRPAMATAATASGNNEVIGSDAILERIVELETKLEEDLSRKKRFQKPALQAKWRQEIDELNRQL